MNTADVQSCVLDVLRDLYTELGRPIPADFGADTRLFGGADGFDSVTLVTFIADLEGRIAERFGHEVVLADERAMSARLSPFRRVGSLVDLIVIRLQEAGVTSSP
jgi:hypothetical protein